MTVNDKPIRTQLTTDQILPEPYVWRLSSVTRMWESVMVRRGAMICHHTRTFGRMNFSWYPNQRRKELLTITCYVSVEYGYTFEENWLLLLHGLTGLGYARAVAIFQSQRSCTITTTKQEGYRQYAIPYKSEYSR